MSPTAAMRRDTRLLSVTGAWVRGTWVDDAVLEHCRRSAAGGFGFRVRSEPVGDALVEAGLARRDDADPRLLTGTARAAALETPAPAAPTPAPRAPRAGFVAEPTAADRDGREFLGFCASAHHAAPVEATVRGRRQRSATDPRDTEPAALCDRCADLLSAAGFFRAR